MTEAKVKSFQKSKGLTEDGRVDERTGRALVLPYWDAQVTRTLDPPFRDSDVFPTGHQFIFRSQYPGGHFGSSPDQFVSNDPRTKRAIRTNNPGALNISQWQKSMAGYVGRTQPDSSSSANKTTIYLSPEQGITAWCILVVQRYEQIYHLISSHGTGRKGRYNRLGRLSWSQPRRSIQATTITF
jgi:D-alanyl-D-alanine carboxypeptidase